MGERFRREPWLSLFLTVDSVLYFVLLYLAVDSFLLWRDGARAGGATALRLLWQVCGIALLALANPLGRAATRARGWRGAIPWDAVVLAGFSALLFLATGAASVKQQSFLWLASEWHKIPLNFALIVRLSPLAAPAIALGFFSVLWLPGFFGGLGRRIALALLGASLAYSFFSTTTIGAAERVTVYILVFTLPGLVAFWGLWRGARRLSARATVISCILTLLLTHYVAHLPWTGWQRQPAGAGLEKLYPAPGKPADFPLAFLREFVLDEPSGYLFTSFGPTSGLVRLDMKKSEVRIIPTGAGTVRNLLREPGSEWVRALDWVNGDLLKVRPDPFEVSGMADITAGRYIVPMSFCSDGGGRIYVVSTEWPGLVEVDAAEDPPSVRRVLDFRAMDLTRLRSGAWGSSLWAEARSLFVVVGIVDADGNYLLVRVDLDRFKVTGTARIPSGGPWLMAIPEKGTVMTAGFYDDVFSEFDARTLALKRTFHGVTNCRRGAYDPARDLFYAEGFLTGEIVAYRYADAVPLKRLWIGKRALSLAFVAESDSLYLGSAEGIFRLSLAEWVGPKPRAMGEP